MVNQQKVIEILRNIGETIEKEKLFLTELDNVIDHGINLSRGFQEVEKKLDTLADKDIGTILKTVGMTLVSTVGGASGPLYGTAFMKAGQLMAGKDAVDINDFVEILRVSIEGVKMRGKSTTGEKTMLDAMVPALAAMEGALKAAKDPKEILLEGVEAAEDGVAYTKTIIATKGRASYLGERSIGHQDPGATSFNAKRDCQKFVRRVSMVGIVIVSHSRELADSIVEFTKMMAPEALIRAAGGMDDGTLGTSYEKIYQAIEDVYSEDGVLVMMDMGSAVMTTEMVLEEMSDKKIEMIDCPIVEGAVAATVAASAGADFEEVKQNALEAKTAAKF